MSDFTRRAKNYLQTYLALLAYGGPPAWPFLAWYFLLKIVRWPAKIILPLRAHRWVAFTRQSSGLHFFCEVVIKECYWPIRDDIKSSRQPLIVDAGANCGAFALWALSLNPAARVLSFEPGQAFDNLALNRQLFVERQGNRWQVEKCALSSKNGIGRFAQFAESSMGSLSDEGALESPIRTLDSFGQVFDIIKIDVESHEAEVLRGSDQVLATTRAIIIECHSEELRLVCTDLLLAHHFVLQNYGRGDGLLMGRRP